MPAALQDSSRPTDQTRAANRKRVLETLRRVGSAARIELAEQADLSPATVSVITADLLDDGLVREIAESGVTATRRRGRPRTLLEINPAAAFAVGIKVSMHQTAVSLTNFVGDVLVSDSVTVRADREAQETIARTCEARVSEILASADIDPDLVLGVGVGVPGFVEYRSGVVRWGPLFADRDVPLRAIIEHQTGLKTFVDNDANMIALAEKWFGRGRDQPTLLVITVEHGVGMGLIIDGRLHRGARGFGAEVGHTKIVVGGADCRCGQRGCLEAYVSDYAIARDLAAAGTPIDMTDPIAVHEAIDASIRAADGGDTRAAEVFRSAGAMLGVGISNLVRVLDPPLILLSGERARSAAAFFEGLHAALADNQFPMDAVPTSLVIDPAGDAVWARGAAALVLEETPI